VIRTTTPRRAPLRLATQAERAATLKSIASAEATMLSPGWDEGLEHQFGATLPTTPRTAPTLTVVHSFDVAECGFGACAINPACTKSCFYREAEKALGRGARSTVEAKGFEWVEPSPMFKGITIALAVLAALAYIGTLLLAIHIPTGR
jgi:hypothetical protein